MPRRRDHDLLKALGARLGEVRRRKQWTQERLAEAIGIQPVSLSRLETGDRALSLSTLAAAADALGVPFGELVDVDRPLPEPVEDPKGEALHRIWVSLDEHTKDLVLRIVREIAER